MTGKSPIIFSDADAAIWNERFAVVIYHAQGVAAVWDELKGEFHRFTRFYWVYGARAKRWLAHPLRLTYTTEEQWRRRARREIGDAAKVIAPTRDRR